MTNAQYKYSLKMVERKEGKGVGVGGGGGGGEGNCSLGEEDPPVAKEEGLVAGGKVRGW